MSAVTQVPETRSVEDDLNRLYSELADVKRRVIVMQSEPWAAQASPAPGSPDAWLDLQQVVDEVSAAWRGPKAVEEVRSQRGE